MAVLALGFIGSAIGASIGGTILGIGAATIGGYIGSFIGSEIDALIAGPSHSEGPRLTDLTVTSSAYGQGIPLIYGTYRTSGNIIWTTGLIEKKVKVKQGGKGGGGKGSSTTLYYYYHCSAVGLCGGPILGVNRIWGDSKLISKSMYDASVGATPATGSIIFSQQPTNGQGFQINGRDYVFNTSIDTGTDGSILIGPNLTQTIENAVQAINTGRAVKVGGDPQAIGSGVNYSAVTARNGIVTAGVNSGVLTLVAGAVDDTFQPVGPEGADGNGVTISTNVTGALASGATLTGGVSGTYSDDASAIAALANRIVQETTSATGEPTSAQVAGQDGSLSILEGGGLVPNTAGALPETVYLGDESQTPNSLMESFLGAGNVPGYRGLAYVVFNFQPLLDFGNRIPNFNFEVVAHRGITLGNIVADIMLRGGYTADQFDCTELNEPVQGYAVSRNMTPRDAIQPLMSVYAFDVVEVNGVIRFRKRAGQTTGLVTLSEDDLAAYAYGDDRPEPLTIETIAESELPVTVTMTYIDPARDFQPNTVSSTRQTVQSSSVVNYNVPIVMTSDRAQQAVEELQYKLWQDRRSFTFTTDWSKLNTIQPGNNIAIDYRSRTHFMRLEKLTVRQPGLLEWTGRQETVSVYKSNATGDSGTIPQQVLDTPGEAYLFLMDAPLMGDTDPDPGFYFGARAWGTWRGATLFESTDGGTNFNAIENGFSEETSVGVAATVLPDYDAGIGWDRGNSVYVSMDEGELESVQESAALMNDNNAMLGSELIAFKTATLVDPDLWQATTAYEVGDVVKSNTPHTSYFRCETAGTTSAAEPTWAARGFTTTEVSGIIWRTIPTNYYKLTGLVRGRRGTEWATGTHVKAENFILLNGLWIGRHTQNVNEIGVARQYKIVPVSVDEAEVTAEDFTNTGVSSKPLSPVHLKAYRDISGATNDLALSWHRRTRIGGGWSDNIDAPLGENVESYDIEILNGGGSVVRSDNVTSEAYAYTAAMQGADGISTSASTIRFRVYQRSGVVGRGYVADYTVNIKPK